MTRYPESLQKIILLLRKLPGVGKKTAERYAFQMISWKKEDQELFASLVAGLKKNLTICSECGAIYEGNHCFFCNTTHRDPLLLCIVSSPKDIFSLENTRLYNGLYHVMPGLISPIDGIGPEELHLEHLKNRIQKHAIREVILALDSTIEGDATSLYLKKEIESLGVFVSRLGLGMPMGSSLEYVDEGTLSRAFSSRSPL
jgi:recombination protein RecR